MPRHSQTGNETRGLLTATLKDGFIYLPAQLAPTLLGFVSVPIFTRIFPPSEYGEQALVGALVPFLLIGLAWCHEAAMRFFPNYEKADAVGDFLWTAIVGIFVSTGLLCVVGALVVPYLSTSLVGKYGFLAPGIFLAEGLYAEGLQLLRITRNAKAYTLVSLSFSTVKLLVAMALVFLYRRRIDSLLWAWLLTDLLMLPLIANRLSLLARLRQPRWREIAAGLRRFFSYGLLFVPSAAAWSTINLIDRFFISYYGGPTEVGLYSISYVPSVVLSLGFTMLGFASYPIIISTWEREGQARTEEFLSGLFRLYLLACVPLGLGVSLLGRDILSILAGHAYLQAATAVPYVAMGCFFQSLLPLAMKSFVLLKRPGLNLLVALAGAGVNIGLNFVLIPASGYVGAAQATAVTYLSVVTLAIALSKWYLKFSYHLPLLSGLRIGVASAAMVGSVLLTQAQTANWPLFLRLIAAISVGAISYGAVLVALAEITVADFADGVRAVTRRSVPAPDEEASP